MKYFLMAIFILLVGGCSRHQYFSDVSIPSSFVDKTKSSKQEQLLRRFNEYWHYRLKKDYKKTYNYELPYQRYEIDFQRYKGLLDGYGKDAKVKLIAISYAAPDVAIIQRKIITKSGALVGKDKWIYVNGVWYHKFFQNILPPTNEEEREFQ